MSKSLGNTVDPNQVSNKLGADILRLWVSSVDYQSDVRISDNILTQISENYRKIRNTLRFLLGNLNGFNPYEDQVEFGQLNELDQFALIRLNRMAERVLKAYEKYEFHVVYQSIHHFCAVELSAFYLDIIKDRLYASAPNDAGRKAAQSVLYDALMSITKLMAPILPYTADEVWKFIPGTELPSVQMSEFPAIRTAYYNDTLESKWNRFIDIRDEALKALEEARQGKVIGNSLSAALHLYPTAETREVLSQLSELDQLFIVSAVYVHGEEESAPDSANKHMAVEVEVADGEKCERCWIVTPEVGQSQEHPTLCKRCAAVVETLEL